MKMTGEKVFCHWREGQPAGRTLCYRQAILLLAVACTAIISAARAQETVTNAGDFATIIDQPNCLWPLQLPYETDGMMFWPQDVWFLDLSSLTGAVAAVTNYPSQNQNGVNAWPLRLVQAADTGAMVLKYVGASTNVALLQIDAPTNYVPFDHYDTVLGVWCLLQAGQSSTTPCTNLVAEGYSFLDPRWSRWMRGAY